MATSIWVIKLGGSLAYAPELRQWLALLQQQQLPLVVVPGGGNSAKSVQYLQQHWNLSDQVAHQAALLAMEQFALVLAELAPALIPCNTLEDMQHGLSTKQAMLWKPVTTLAQHPELPCGWQFSADAIAAWLARQLRAHLLLVKSRVLQQPQLELWLRAGLVDMALRDWQPPLGKLWICHKSAYSSLPDFLNGQDQNASLHC